MKQMNLPNKLTLLRVILVPLFVVFLVVPMGLPATAAKLIACAIFIASALTDMLDGMIARKYDLITDFGKFMDPLADKFLVFAALLAICVSDYFAPFRPIMVWVALIVFLRELAITSMRLLVAGKDGVVVAANWLGKVKTVSQIVFICAILIESTWAPWPLWIISFIAAAVMTVFTVLSGINYLRCYWQSIDPTK